MLTMGDYAAMETRMYSLGFEEVGLWSFVAIVVVVAVVVVGGRRRCHRLGLSSSL